MCGPADFTALTQCGLRVAALAAAGGGLYTALRVRQMLTAIRAQGTREENKGTAKEGAREGARA